MENLSVIDLTKKLISIPSYVGSDCNEKKIADFLVDYLKRLSWMKIIKQGVDRNRYNIILKDRYPTKFLVIGHMDTVQPRSGWTTNQLEPIVMSDKLFGLGASDMKGNLASFISALQRFKKTKGLMILLYIDEEYDFLGIKRFIEDYKNKIKPKLILSLDGKELEIGNGCRGLIEFSCMTKGRTGHASRPNEGINAIEKSVKVIDEFKKYIGKTTCNLAYLKGGLYLGEDKKKNIKVGREGNNIADIAEFVLDIRPTNAELNAVKVIIILGKILEKEKIRLVDFKIRHDFSSWITPKRRLSEIEEIIDKNKKVKYAKIENSGFIDVSFLYKTFNKVPTFILGAGEKGRTHAVNEYVSINKLLKAKDIYVKLIEAMGGGEKI